MAKILKNPATIINIGIEDFVPALTASGVENLSLDWSPAAGGDPQLLELLFRLALLPGDKEGLNRIDRANIKAFNRIIAGQPLLTGIKPAHQVIDMDEQTIFHAGPPIEWQNMCGPMKGAFLGAIVYEGLADNLEQARILMDKGKIDYAPNHSISAVGPMTGIISYSMPVFVVRNDSFGNQSYCTINEGLGKVMRFGANDMTVIEQLKWLEQLALVLDRVIQEKKGLNLGNIIAKALAMGDEMHQRNTAASLLFFQEIAPALLRELVRGPEGLRISEFLLHNQQFFLNLAMVSAKAMMDPAGNIEHCSLVTAMSRNGVDFGIKISALGDQWFSAPCEMPNGRYFPGFSENDANPDMGDSSIIECLGLGGMAIGSSPAVVNFVGAGSAAEAQRYTRQMQRLVQGENHHFPMPNLDFQGVPTGIDIIKVVDSGVLPIINTGIAHKEPGVGQIGAGIVHPPLEIFIKALRSFATKEGSHGSG